MRSILLLAFLGAMPDVVFAVQIGAYAHDPTCFNSDGSITVWVTGGAPPYTYQWSDGATTASRTGLSAGFYSLTVTDSGGDTDNYGVTLVAGTMPLPGVTYAGMFPCPMQSDGAFAVLNSLTPGTPPYTVSLEVNGTPMGQTGTFNGDPLYVGVAQGDQVYYTVTDASGCVGSDLFTVDGPLGIAVNHLGNTPVCGSSLGSIVIEPNSADWPMDITVYDWNNQVVGQSYQSIDPLTLTGLAAGYYAVVQNYTWSMVNQCMGISTAFTIGDLGPNCGTVSGTSWYDLDADCVQDAAEVPIPFSPLVIQPGNLNVLTDSSGHYGFPIVNGSYTLDQADPTLVSICPGTIPTPFTMNTNAQVIPLANVSTEPLDLAVYASHEVARPGFITSVWGTVRNLSPQASGPVTLSVTFDPGLSFVNASPAPSNVAGNLVTWTFPQFVSFQDEDFSIALQVPAGMALGTLLTEIVSVSNSLPDADPMNDQVQAITTVVGSFDPNDKRVRTSTAWSEDTYIIGTDDWLEYTIRFQNTGTDTAFTVVVTDVIDADLDMGTFEQGTASHPFNVSFKPGRMVEWRFANILLPDSNTNEAASHGALSFRIRPVQPVLPGTVLTNAADIFFDLNAPIHTNDAVVVAGVSTLVQEHSSTGSEGQLRVWPNPADQVLSFSLSDTTGPYAIDVIGADGRLWERLRTNLAQVDVGALPAGAYALRVNGQVSRFVKR